jgi:uncharacterized membrane protein YagU involved in acid resistance
MNNLIKAVIAGFAGTMAMTLFAMMAPMMGMPEMNVPKMLSMTMGLPQIAGWAGHFMIGIIIAISYSLIFAEKIKANPVVKGIIFSVIPWLMAQLIVMPMMSAMNGMSFTSGIFSGSFIMALGSLMGHFVYGAVLGGIYRVNTSEYAINENLINSK